jgi:hypothetical protein
MMAEGPQFLVRKERKKHPANNLLRSQLGECVVSKRQSGPTPAEKGMATGLVNLGRRGLDSGQEHGR